MVHTTKNGRGPKNGTTGQPPLCIAGKSQSVYPKIAISLKCFGDVVKKLWLEKSAKILPTYVFVSLCQGFLSRTKLIWYRSCNDIKFMSIDLLTFEWKWGHWESWPKCAIEIKLPEVFPIVGCSRIPLSHFKRDCDSKPAISPIIAENQKIQRGKGQEIVLKKYPFFKRVNCSAR